MKIPVESIVNSEKEGRMVVTNPQSGLVVVTGMPDELKAVREFLDASELSVKRQVILETQILEIKLSEGFEAGVNWSKIQGQLGYQSSSFYEKSRASGINSGSDELFTSALDVVDINQLLSLLSTQGAVQVLSSPRVSTVNNQKAVIRVGSDEFFVTGITNDTTSSVTATTTSPNVEMSSFFSGISLDVTPQISEEGEVILHIHPIVSEVRDQLKEFVVGDSKFSLPLALRDIRESDSIVRAKNGQVVVLGGLMQKSSSDLNTEKPVLGRIPIAKAFFKTKNRAKQKTELVILMRPVVVEAGTWNQQISDFDDFSKMVGEEYRTR